MSDWLAFEGIRISSHAWLLTVYLSPVTHATWSIARFDLGHLALLPLHSHRAAWLQGASRRETCSANWQAYMSWHFLEQNPSAFYQASMNVRNLILWIFVTALLEVALEELNEGKNAGQLASGHPCCGRTRCHPHPFTQLSGEHASTCTLTCSCHQLFFRLILQLQYGSIPSEEKSCYKTTYINIRL